jgi:hypothetical protein
MHRKHAAYILYLVSKLIHFSEEWLEQSEMQDAQADDATVPSMEW